MLESRFSWNVQCVTVNSTTAVRTRKYLGDFTIETNNNNNNCHFMTSAKFTGFLLQLFHNLLMKLT